MYCLVTVSRMVSFPVLCEQFLFPYWSVEELVVWFCCHWYWTVPSPAIVAYNFWCTKNLKCLCFLSRCWNTFGLVMYTDRSYWVWALAWSCSGQHSLKQLFKTEDLCQGYQCSGVAPTAVQYVFLKSEYLLFVYIVLWGISDANEENLYISSIGLDGVYFSSFLEKDVCFNPNPTNISCCCLLWSRLSSFVRLSLSTGT